MTAQRRRKRIWQAMTTAPSTLTRDWVSSTTVRVGAAADVGWLSLAVVVVIMVVMVVVMVMVVMVVMVACLDVWCTVGRYWCVAWL